MNKKFNIDVNINIKYQEKLILSSFAGRKTKQNLEIGRLNSDTAVLTMTCLTSL